MANAWILKPLPAAAVATFGTIQLGAGSYLFNDYAGVVCQLGCDDGTSATIQIDLGVDTVIDTLLAFGVELIPADRYVTVRWATSAQGSGFGEGSFSADSAPAYAGPVMPTSGKGVTLWAPAAAVTARYLRLTYEGVTNGVSVRVSRIAIGQRIQLERNFGFGGTFGVKDLGSVDFSARGVLLRRRAKKMRTAALTFSNIEKDEVEALTKPLLEQIGNTEMIALVTDPSPNAQRQNRCYFGPLVGDLGHTWRNARAWEAKVSLVSIF